MVDSKPKGFPTTPSTDLFQHQNPTSSISATEPRHPQRGRQDGDVFATQVSYLHPDVHKNEVVNAQRQGQRILMNSPCFTVTSRSEEERKHTGARSDDVGRWRHL